MLLLRLETPQGRYLLDTSLITEIIPLVQYTKVPHSPEYLAGMINFRGQAVPVVDLGWLIDEMPCRELMNTRIIILRLVLREGEKPLLGIIAEGVSGTLRLDRSAIESSEMLPPELFDPMEAEGRQFVQFLDIEKILGPERMENLAAYC